MLIDIDRDRPIKDVPFRRDFDILRSRLSEAEFDAIGVATFGPTETGTRVLA